MLENLLFVEQSESIVNGLFLCPESKRITISWRQIWACLEEEKLMLSTLENGASSRNIRSEQRQHLSWKIGVQKLIDRKVIHDRGKKLHMAEATSGSREGMLTI